jgi:SP family arabinose:H+ symporter-like MFS transporter
MSATINVRYITFLACTAALGGLLFGFDIAIITGAGPFIARDFGLGDFQFGSVFSSLLFGCVFGSLAAGRLADRFGRKRLLVLVAALFALASIASAGAGSLSSLLVARFFGGLAVGGVSLLSPMYVAEVSPPSIRGRLGTLYQMSIVVGIIASYGINYLLRNVGTGNWRWMFLTGVLPSFVFFVFILLAPESPRFLVVAGRPEDAFIVLEKIGGSAIAHTQIAEITETLRIDREFKGSHLRPGVRRALIASVCLAILIQVSGINTIIDYAPTIFLSARWGIDAALASTFFVGVTELIFSLVSLWTIDRYGRKPLYIVGSFGMALCLLGLVVTIITNRFYGVPVLTLIMIYLAFFSACIGPVFWTLIPEIFPNDVRGKAMAVPVFMQWLANALVVLFFPFAFHAVGKVVTFGFLAAMCLCQGIFVMCYVPETKNKHLEEIEAYWG